MLFPIQNRWNILKLRKAFLWVQEHTYTIWLFTFSDLKTIILPTSTFGIIGAFSGPPLLSDSLQFGRILSRIPLVFFWTWSTLLPFAINNQSGRSAILEDSINKPWRPLPSGRISLKTATCYMIALYCINFTVSVILGVQWQALSMLLLGIWCNRFGGADRHCVEKNVINAAGYISFVKGALGVAIHTRATAVTSGSIAIPWLVSVGLVIATTVHTQDFEDMEGDVARGRQTVPLVIGENAARLSIGVAVPVWSIFIPLHFRSQGSGYIAPIILGTIIAYRFLMQRAKQDDKRSFQLWNLWIVSLYMIPLFVKG